MIESVKLIECPRDAWQGLPGQIPTHRKVNYLCALIAAGFRHIDAVSFVSPKAVPQMADSEQVLEQLGRVNDVEIIGIVVNEKGADRAVASGGVTTLGYPCSISPTFLRRNQNQSLEENYAILQSIKRRADEAGLRVVAYLSMAFGNPYGDSWSEENVAAAASEIAATGIDAISVADTAATATPEVVSRVLRAVLRECVECEVGVHMHTKRAGAAAKILAAYDAGCRRFDAAMGGLGGCPFAQDEMVGNIPTEEVLRTLQRREVTLPVEGQLARVNAMNAEISLEFSSDKAPAE